MTLVGIHRAFERLRKRYAEVGGWRYPGSLGLEDDYGYLGPWAWSEGDYQYHFARLLEDEFPGSVHVEMPVRPAFFADLDLPPGPKGTAHIDIVISDLRGLPADVVEAGRAFRRHGHDAFIEVKWFLKAVEKWKSINWRDFHRGVEADARRLSKYKQRGWCGIAALLIVDDRGWHVDRMTELEVPADVE